MKPEGVRELEDKGDDWAAYKKQYAPKREPTPEEVKRVIAFARLVHKADDATFRKEIESYLEVEEYLRYLAATSFVANSDSFFALGHNYYLYLDPGTRRFRFLPWDLDRAFSNLPILGTNKQQMDLSLVRPYGGTHRLTDRLLAVPGVAARYQELLAELQAGCFARERLLRELDSLEAATRDLLARDVKATAARKESGFPAIYVNPPTLRKFLERRAESVAEQLAGRSKGHVPGAGFRFGLMLAGPLMETLDADKDELLSKEEWTAVVKRVFAEGKKDDAGRLTQKGVAAAINGMFPKPAAGAPQPPPGFGLGDTMAGPILKRSDADKDGKVALDELLAAADTIFVEVDKDKSGKLDEATFADLLDRLLPPPNVGAKPAEVKKEPKKP
jgi:hypothetical protein